MGYSVMCDLGSFILDGDEMTTVERVDSLKPRSAEEST